MANSREAVLPKGRRSIPEETIRAFARSIVQAAQGYGFGRADGIRLISALMDLSVQGWSNGGGGTKPAADKVTSVDDPSLDVDGFPLRSKRLRIRLADPARDVALIESWMHDKYGQHFLLSCATAQRIDVSSLMENTSNHVGIVALQDGHPIGAVAFLDHDDRQRRAEMRKLIGDPDARGKGYAEEATVLWLKYGVEKLGLEKVYVSTLQNHLRNIQLNESVGFRIEGVLADEVLLDGMRQDVLRMGFSRAAPRAEPRD